MGSGKSTVARMFKNEGAYLIDFDSLARLVVEVDKPAWRDIIDYFGPEILSPDRSLNRSALAEIVFSDDKSRKILEGFTHPRIFKERDALIEVIKKKDSNAVVIVDFPLLFELSLSKKFDMIILAFVSRDVQLERIIKRDGLTKEEAERRLSAQIPIEEKKRLSDYIVYTNGSLNDTRSQVRKVADELKGLAKKKEVDSFVFNKRERDI